MQKIFYWICPLPLLSLLGLKIYLSSYDGWGLWAAAPLFLGPILLSLMIGGMGAVLIVFAKRQQEPTGGLWAATLLAGSFFLYILAAALLRNLF